MGSARALERYAWIGGVLYVIALITESVISLGFKISQDDSAAKIANSLADHHTRLIVVFCLCIFYVVGSVIYLTRLNDPLRRGRNDRRFFAGLLVFATRVLPRWLGWIAVASSPFFFLQSFGLGGVVSSLGLTLDLIGFLLFLIFVLASSVIGLTRAPVIVPAT